MMNRLKYYFNLYKNRRNYMRIVNCVSPNKTIQHLKSYNSNTLTGSQLEIALRFAGIGLRIGTIKMNDECKNIIILDLKFSGYERTRGRYIIYTFTKNNANQYNCIHYFPKECQRLPNYFKDNPQMLQLEFD